MQHAKHDANLLLICLQRPHPACHRLPQQLSVQRPQGKIPSHPALETCSSIPYAEVFASPQSLACQHQYMTNCLAKCECTGFGLFDDRTTHSGMPLQ